MTYFDAYLLTRLDSFKELFEVFVFSAILIVGINFITQLICVANHGFAFSKEDEGVWTTRAKKVFSYFKFTIPFLVIVLIFKSLIPTTKEAAFIYIAPAIVNNQDVRKTIKKLPELSGLGLEYLGEILKQEIKDTKQEAASTAKSTIKEVVKNVNR